MKEMTLYELGRKLELIGSQLKGSASSHRVMANFDMEYIERFESVNNSNGVDIGTVTGTYLRMIGEAKSGGLGNSDPIVCQEIMAMMGEENG